MRRGSGPGTGPPAGRLPDLSGHVLGRTREPVTLEGGSATHCATLALLRQCRRTVDIVSRELEARVYDRPDVIEAIRTLAIGSRGARIRVLVRDPTRAIAEGHRLIQLARQLSTFVQIRTLGSQHRAYNCALVIADGTGILVRKLADRFEGEVSFSDPVGARDLTRLFEAMWAVALEDPDLRSLHI